MSLWKNDVLRWLANRSGFLPNMIRAEPNTINSKSHDSWGLYVPRLASNLMGYNLGNPSHMMLAWCVCYTFGHRRVQNWQPRQVDALGIICQLTDSHILCNLSMCSCFKLYRCCIRHILTRADSRLAPSQWETSLQSKTVSHWLGANLESALLTVP